MLCSKLSASIIIQSCICISCGLFKSFTGSQKSYFKQTKLFGTFLVIIVNIAFSSPESSISLCNDLSVSLWHGHQNEKRLREQVTIFKRIIFVWVIEIWVSRFWHMIQPFFKTRESVLLRYIFFLNSFGRGEVRTHEPVLKVLLKYFVSCWHNDKNDIFKWRWTL